MTVVKRIVRFFKIEVLVKEALSRLVYLKGGLKRTFFNWSVRNKITARNLRGRKGAHAAPASPTSGDAACRS